MELTGRSDLEERGSVTCGMKGKQHANIRLPLLTEFKDAKIDFVRIANKSRSCPTEQQFFERWMSTVLYFTRTRGTGRTRGRAAQLWFLSWHRSKMPASDCEIPTEYGLSSEEMDICTEQYRVTWTVWQGALCAN